LSVFKILIQNILFLALECFIFPLIPIWHFKVGEHHAIESESLVFLAVLLNPMLGWVPTAKCVVAELSKISGLPYLDSVIVFGQLISETEQSCDQFKALKKGFSAFTNR